MSAGSCCDSKTNPPSVSIHSDGKARFSGSPFVSVIKEFAALWYTLTEGALLISPASTGTRRAHATSHVSRDPCHRYGSANVRKHKEIRRQRLSCPNLSETALESFGPGAHFAPSRLRRDAFRGSHRPRRGAQQLQIPGREPGCRITPRPRRHFGWAWKPPCSRGSVDYESSGSLCGQATL
jgi:hypothetical protein